MLVALSFDRSIPLSSSPRLHPRTCGGFSLWLPRGIYYSLRFLFSVETTDWRARARGSWKRRLNLFKTRDSSPPKAELSRGMKFISPRTHSCVPRGL